MMAAAACRSGTTSPFASVLKCGSGASRTIRAARARASFARRARDALAEYRTFAFLTVVDRLTCCRAVCRVAASADGVAGARNPRSARAHTTRAKVCRYLFTLAWSVKLGD